MAALLLYALIILGVFIISCIPQSANAQSTSSGDVLPGRGIIIVNHQAVIDSNIVMLAQRAADSITNLKATIASKVTLAAAIAGLSMTTTGTLGAASYNNSTGVFNIPQYAGTVTSVGLSSSDFTISGSPVTTSGSITANLNTSGITAGTYNGSYTVDAKGRLTAANNISINNAPSVTIQTVAAAANGTQVSSTRAAQINYSVTVVSTATIAGGAVGYVALEICSTNSATASDWLEVGRIPNGQAVSLAITLQSVSTGGGQVGAILPAGWYRRLRSVNTTGSQTFTYNSGQECIL